MAQRLAAALFTEDGVHAAALNQDGTLNSTAHPAPAAGPISPAQADGSLVGLPLPVNTRKVGVSIACAGNEGLFPVIQPVPEAVDYGGPAPFELAGITQINFHMNLCPGDNSVGESVPWVLLSVDGAPAGGFIDIYVAKP